MASIIQDVFNSVSIKKIISVVTDNAKNMICSWKILKEKFKDENISYYGCAAHVLNLLNKDLMQLNTFSLLEDSAKKICVEFKQSHILNSLLKEFQNADSDIMKKKITLKLPIVTRWGSNLQCLKSLIFNKQYLQQIAISPKAIKYLSKNSSAKILDNDVFWPKVEKLINILEPISIWIKTLESEASNLSDVVCAFHQIKEKIKNSVSVSKDLQNILSCIEKRKKMATEQIHLAAHLLDPRYKGKYLTKEESVDASQFIYSLANYINLHQTDVLCDLANYRTNSGLWARDFVWNCLNTKSDSNKMSIITWWNGICSSTNLAIVATAILQCPPTSASTERSFSTYGLVHTAKRNRLTTDRASKLVYVKHNLKLQKSNDEEYLECPEDNNLETVEIINSENEEDELLEEEEDIDIDADETESIFQAVNNKHKDDY